MDRVSLENIRDLIDSVSQFGQESWLYDAQTKTWDCKMNEEQMQFYSLAKQSIETLLDEVERLHGELKTKVKVTYGGRLPIGLERDY